MEFNNNEEQSFKPEDQAPEGGKEKKGDKDAQKEILKMYSQLSVEDQEDLLLDLNKAYQKKLDKEGGDKDKEKPEGKEENQFKQAAQDLAANVF